MTLRSELNQKHEEAKKQEAKDNELWETYNSVLGEFQDRIIEDPRGYHSVLSPSGDALTTREAALEALPQSTRETQ